MLRRLSFPIAEIFIVSFCLLLGVGITTVLLEITKPFRVKEIKLGPVEGLTQEEMNELSKEIDTNRNSEVFMIR